MILDGIIRELKSLTWFSLHHVWSFFIEPSRRSYCIKRAFPFPQVSYRFLALGCFPANLVSYVVCVLFVLRVGSLKG